MKKILFLLITLLSISVFAQDEIKEGSVTMKMTLSSDNEQAKAQLAMIGDIPITVYFKNENSRTEQKSQMIGDNTTIVNNKAKKILVLMDNPMAGKKYVENNINISEEDLKNITVTATGDSKTIAGYNCKGYTVEATKNGVKTKVTMYVTDKIKALTQNNVSFGDKLKGFPMYLTTTVKQGPMDMVITLEVTDAKNEKIDDALFDMTIPEGYSKMEAPKPAGID